VDKVENLETMIDFIRHGEPDGGKMYRGNQVDHPLSELGWQQMHEAINKQYIGQCPDNQSRWDLIISSPMLRCYAYAEVLSQQLAIPLVTNTVLTEITFGELEGTPTQRSKPLILFYFAIFIVILLKTDRLGRISRGI